MICYVTGANGFVGRHLCSYLVQLGYNVVKGINVSKPTPKDIIIHLAAKTSTALDFDYELIETNLFYTSFVFQHASRIIFASSCSAGHLTCPYAYTKRYGEHLALKHPNAVALRFHNIYGLDATRGIVKVLMEQNDGTEMTIRGPALIRDYIHVHDVCTAIINCVENGQQGILDVGTAIGTSTISLVNKYMELSGKQFNLDFKKPYEHEPLRMVAERELPIPCMNLKTGLLKVINYEDTYYGA